MSPLPTLLGNECHKHSNQTSETIFIFVYFSDNDILILMFGNGRAFHLFVMSDHFYFGSLVMF